MLVKMQADPGAASVIKFNTKNQIIYSERFSTYISPAIMNMRLLSVFDELNSAGKKIHNHNAWNYNSLREIFELPKQGVKDSLRELAFSYKIPEGHIYVKNKEPIPGQLFPVEQIYISAHACQILVAKLLKQNSDFFSQMRLGFAKCYFWFNDPDYEYVLHLTWCWVSAEDLTPKFKDARLCLARTIAAIMGVKTYDKEVSKIIQDWVYDSLFAYIRVNGGQPYSFYYQYRDAIEKFGYSDVEEFFGGKIITRHKKDDGYAQKMPGSFISPHAMFLLTCAMSDFCACVYDISRRKEIKDRATALIGACYDIFAGQAPINSFEDIKFFAAEYFTVFRAELDAFMKERHRRRPPLFFDAATVSPGKILKEMERDSDFSKDVLFDDEERWCREYRQCDERKLFAAHKEYAVAPNEELAKDITKLERLISDSCEALYGINFQGYVAVPDVLNGSAFAKRDLFGKNPVPQGDAPIGAPAFPPSAAGKEFFIAPGTNIPNGIPFACREYTDKKDGKEKKYYTYSAAGNLESVNPLIAAPTKLNKRGWPTNADANFGFCNFLYESDNLSLEEQTAQAARLVSIGVVNRVVFSGGKSLHMRVTIKNAPKSRDEYKWLFRHIAETYDIKGIDYQCGNNGRLTRRPNASRIDRPGAPGQTLIHNSDVVLDLNWRPMYTKYLMEQMNNARNAKQFYKDAGDDIGSFINNYVKKHPEKNIDLSFGQGLGHSSGTILIGAAKKANFAGAQIDAWLCANCERYEELIDAWKRLLR
jgi:hypothetical protein